MFRCKPLPVALFAIWTLFVWGQRLVNIKNSELEGFELAWSTGRAIIFVIIGLAVAVVAVKPVADRTQKLVVSIAAAITIGLWCIQVVLIALRDYSVGFIVVHAVLGVVSVGLAWWALQRAGSGSDTVREQSSARSTNIGA